MGIECFQVFLPLPVRLRSVAPHKAVPQGCLVVPSEDYSHGQALLSGLDL